MHGRWTRIKDGEYQRTVPAGVHMKTRYVHEAAELRFGFHRDERHGVFRHTHRFLGQQEGELPSRNRERLALGEQCLGMSARRRQLGTWGSVEFTSHMQRNRITVYS